MTTRVIGAVALACVLGCGGGGEATKPPVTIGLADASAPAPQVKTGKSKLGIPRDPALVVTADISLLMKVGPVVQELSRILEVQGDLAGNIGLDTSRPAVLVVSAPDSATQSVIDELKPLASKPATSLTMDACKKVHSLPLPGFVRVMLPTSNAEALEHAVGVTLEKEDGWTHVRDGYTKGHSSIAMSDDDAYVALNLGAQGFKSMSAQGLRGMENAREPVPSLDGRILRASWNVSALAGASYFMDMVTVCGAISGGGVDAAQKQRILAEGLIESAQVFSLATFDRGEAEVTLSPLALTIRAKPGPQLTLPPAAAFAPSPSVTLADAKVTMETAATVLRAWPLPGGDPETFQHMLRDAGGPAILVALPHVVAMMPFLDVSDRRDPMMGDPNVTKRFERLEAIETTSTMSAGVLPAGTALAAARCALDATFPTCPAKSQLKLGGVVKRVPTSGADRFVKLIEVKVAGEPKPRYVVLVAKQESTLASPVTERSVSGLHVEIATKDLLQPVASMSPIPIPDRVTGDATVEDGQLVMKLR